MNSLKKGEGVPLLNFRGGPGVPLLNYAWGPGVPLLNFRRVPGTWSHIYTMPQNENEIFQSTIMKVLPKKKFLPDI